ncbi:MAG TPA: hypothetical protein VJM49_21235, partial [Acidimicrobiales bacterium]|nr:hypothetical protein [Acidimicrobiales bacterium]
MRATDRRTTAAVPGDPDDPDPDVARAALLADTGLDRALAGRLREESRRTRVRVERHLVTSGHLGEDGTPRPSGPEGDVPTAVDDVDAWRDLGEMLDEHVELLDRIDALHERRLRSHSARERQASTRVLAEALHRIVDGYGVEVAEPPGVMAAGQRADAWLGRAL